MWCWVLRFQEYHVFLENSRRFHMQFQVVGFHDYISWLVASRLGAPQDWGTVTATYGEFSAISRSYRKWWTHRNNQEPQWSKIPCGAKELTARTRPPVFGVTLARRAVRFRPDLRELAPTCYDLLSKWLINTNQNHYLRQSTSKRTKASRKQTRHQKTSLSSLAVVFAKK